MNAKRGRFQKLDGLLPILHIVWDFLRRREEGWGTCGVIILVYPFPAGHLLGLAPGATATLCEETGSCWSGHREGVADHFVLRAELVTSCSFLSGSEQGGGAS